MQKYFGLPAHRRDQHGRRLRAHALPVLTRPSRTASPTASRSTSTDRCSRSTTNWQPDLLTTTSTGSGEHFCGGVDGCQYAITPTGHFHFYDLIRGWQKGKLGTMWNPYYFNGSDAVHGLQSVPAYPASHGCARIPMHIADYFYTLVHQGESVFVVGTPKQAGNGYVGPGPRPPATPTTTTTAPKKPDHRRTTAKKPNTGTTVDDADDEAQHTTTDDEAAVASADATTRRERGHASGSANGLEPMVGIAERVGLRDGRPTVSSSMPSSAAMPS